MSAPADGFWALYRARRARTEAEGHAPCEGCGGRGVHYDPEENISLCENCAEGVAEGSERSDPPTGLTHEWNVSVGDDRFDVVQIHGGQPDDNGIPEYVISVALSPGDDHRAAAEQIAAALRGEA